MGSNPLTGGRGPITRKDGSKSRPQTQAELNRRALAARKSGPKARVKAKPKARKVVRRTSRRK